jgi:hypothetical protein
MFEYSLGCSPKRGDEPRDLLRGPTTISIAGNRTQFSRTEGKDFPSERVAVFSLSRLCCQRLCETIFSAVPFWTVSSAACPWLDTRPRGPKRVAGSSLRGLCCQRLCETFFPRLPLRTFRVPRALSSCGASVGSEAGGGVCSRSPSFGKYFCHYLSLSEKRRSFIGFRSGMTHLLCSDRPIGRFASRALAPLTPPVLGDSEGLARGSPPLTACGAPGKAPCLLERGYSRKWRAGAPCAVRRC